MAATLDTLLTPENLVRIYAEKNDAMAAAQRIVLDELGKAGGLFSGILGNGSGGSEPSSGGRSAPSVGGLQLPGGLGNVFGEKLNQQIGQQIGEAVGSQLPSVETIVRDIMKRQNAARAAERSSSGTETPSGDGSSLGFGNIKRFGFNGPLALELGVAANAAQEGSDVLAEMSFTGGDWKLTRIVPGG